MRSRKRRLTYIVRGGVNNDVWRSITVALRTASIFMMSWPGKCRSICSRISVRSSVKRDTDADMASGLRSRSAPAAWREYSIPGNGLRNGVPVVETEKRRQLASRSDEMGVRGHNPWG